MKKYLTIILAAVFVLGFAASALADAVTAKDDTKITLGGELRVRGWYLDNASGTRRAISTPTDGVSQGWYDERVRLRLMADVTQNTSGYVALETSSGTGDSNTWGNLNSKQGGVISILEAWILHKGSGLLGIPAGLKIGHMPLALGEKQFLDHTKFGDDAIVFFMDPSKELHVGLLTAKLSEATSATNSAADIDGYVGLLVYKLDKDNTLGANFSHVNYSDGELAFSNFGLHANGMLAGLSYNTELDLQFGDESPTTEFGGYGFLLGLGYKMDPVTIRGQFAYGSGDDDAADSKNKEFQVTSGNDIHYTQIYEYTTRTAASAQDLANSGGRSSGIANTTYFRLGLDANLTKDLMASIDGFLLNATKAVDSKKIGTEFDAKIAYKIDKNLTYAFMVGYLDTGEWWEDSVLTGTPSEREANNKNIIQAMHSLVLSF
ncbi:MAG: alginate export family protein [Nitrospirae bacterium]|nr:alginate export family protein [Nitrospirota bacterium]